jgi:hypothetical protein
LLAGVASCALIAWPSLTSAAPAAGPTAAKAGDGKATKRGKCANGKRRATKVARSKKRAPRRCRKPVAPGSGPTTPAPGYTPPVSPPANPDCPLSQPGSAVDMTLSSACTTLWSDTAATADPLPRWGHLDCASMSRQQQISSGGDVNSTPTGVQQGDSSFRRVSVVDGDDAWGERCEMGFNWHQASDPGYGISGPGPTVLYREGERRLTYASIRLPNSWDVSDPDWRVVLQMKQAQPFDNPQMASMFEVDVMNGSWLIQSNWQEVWRTPARTGFWTRFAFDVTYSRDPDLGSITIYVDQNGDGDFADSGEQSPTDRRATLLTEVAGGSTGDVPPGESIPSHLRAGLYQNPNYSCPPPNGCHADFDNLQVIRP